MDANEKFLPIGTVCSIKGKNKNVMITGFFSVEYAGNVRMYDYSGCDYPEGLLLRNKICSFNHADIESVQYLGYVTDEYNNFNVLLNKNGSDGTDFQSKDALSNIRFDESGVVIYDSIIGSSAESVVSSIRAVEKQEVENPFRPVSVRADGITTQSNAEDWSIFKSIEFDENGVVVSAVEHGPEEMQT